MALHANDVVSKSVSKTSTVLPTSALFRTAIGFTERSGSMPLLVEAEVAPAQNCHRLVLLGSSKVGKTAIVNRFLNNRFDDKYIPTIEDFHRKVYRIRGEAYRLDILDTSGNNPFPAMKRLSLLTGDLFILVYSIDSRESFDEIRRLINEIFEIKGHQQHSHFHRQQSVITSSSSSLAKLSTTAPGQVTPPVVTASGHHLSSRSPFKNSPPIAIVGNKCDRESSRVVGSNELVRLVESVSQCVGVETSAKKNINIEQAFVGLFCLARLPTEMSPSLHRCVPPNYVGGSSRGSANNSANSASVDTTSNGSGNDCLRQGGILSKFKFISWCRCRKSAEISSSRVISGNGRGATLLMKRRPSDACGAVAPNARRPSIRTDLLRHQTRRGRGAWALFGSSASASSMNGLGLSLGLGAAAAVAGVCASVGGVPSVTREELDATEDHLQTINDDDVASVENIVTYTPESDNKIESAKCAVQ